MRRNDIRSTEDPTETEAPSSFPPIGHLAWTAAIVAALALASPLAAQPPTQLSGASVAPANRSSSTAAVISADQAEKIARGKAYMEYPVFAKLAEWNGQKIYRVDLTVDERLIVRHVYVNAHTGKVLARYTTRGIDDPVWVGGGGGL